MNKKYDKSLVEVWKWKEGVSESLQNLSIKERLEKINEDNIKRLETRQKSSGFHLPRS
ncbi:MAG: hypothetical protein KAW88_05410 [Candidatus Cloacimonetes bacterium]|nr:hypothetical protein [Candidatus Cloacimonadota bacterium]